MKLSAEISFGETIISVVYKLFHIITSMSKDFVSKVYIFIDLVKIQWIDVSLKMTMGHKGSNHRHNLESINLSLACSLRVNFYD